MGPIRELWAVPHFGPTMGLLLEAVIMLIAMIVAARWVVRWFEVPHTLPAMISMGLVALGLLVPAEIGGVVLVRGQSLQDYLASYANGPGVISLIMFPWLQSSYGDRTARVRHRFKSRRFLHMV